MEVFYFLSKMLWKHPPTVCLCMLAKGTWKKRGGYHILGKRGWAGVHSVFQQILASFYESSSETVLFTLTPEKFLNILYLPTIAWHLPRQMNSTSVWTFPSQAVSIPKGSCIKLFLYWCRKSWVKNLNSGWSLACMKTDFIVKSCEVSACRQNSFIFKKALSVSHRNNMKSGIKAPETSGNQRQ